jgi:hypothetical protein
VDYKTKPTSRLDLRRYSIILRRLFDVPLNGAFPVLEVLDKIGDVFKGSRYEVVADCAMIPQTMARCIPNEEGGFTIEIKESVYTGAYEKNVGAFLGFICHEICHVFLFYIGFTPIFERIFKANELPAYCSVEWQAKALSGELMIPYAESFGMKPKQIQETYHVSEGFARYRYKQILNERGNAS